MPVVPNPVSPNSGFHVGVLPFYIDQLGQLYSIREEQNTLKFEPKPVFNTENEALVSLGIGENPISPPETSPTTPFDNILDFDFDEVFGAFVQDFPPVVSPVASEPPTPGLAPDSNTSGGSPPPFSSPGSGILTDDFTNVDLSSPPVTTPPMLPPSPPSPPGGIETQSDIDDHVISLKAHRRRRGAKPSPYALECPKCGKVCRRPHALKEIKPTNDHQRTNVRGSAALNALPPTRIDLDTFISAPFP
ncbi:hypothetical protein FRC10_009656 [Ceratobasidium sp. 414]|nr:hypothetical protein FRC10_009656 [Ceratobasidium sp. 414]